DQVTEQRGQLGPVVEHLLQLGQGGQVTPAGAFENRLQLGGVSLGERGSWCLAQRPLQGPPMMLCPEDFPKSSGFLQIRGLCLPPVLQGKESLRHYPARIYDRERAGMPSTRLSPAGGAHFCRTNPISALTGVLHHGCSAFDNGLSKACGVRVQRDI